MLGYLVWLRATTLSSASLKRVSGPCALKSTTRVPVAVTCILRAERTELAPRGAIGVDEGPCGRGEGAASGGRPGADGGTTGSLRARSSSCCASTGGSPGAAVCGGALVASPGLCGLPEYSRSRGALPLDQTLAGYVLAAQKMSLRQSTRRC